MILIKDRHYKQWASLFDGSYGKYDTYKGSTPLIFQFFHILSPGNYDTYKGSTRGYIQSSFWESELGTMILIKDRHVVLFVISTATTRSLGTMILIKDRHTIVFNRELVCKRWEL